MRRAQDVGYIQALVFLRKELPGSFYTGGRVYLDGKRRKIGSQ
jgi:hypothetical protein